MLAAEPLDETLQLNLSVFSVLHCLVKLDELPLGKFHAQFNHHVSQFVSIDVSTEVLVELFEHRLSMRPDVILDGSRRGASAPGLCDCILLQLSNLRVFELRLRTEQRSR